MGKIVVVVVVGALVVLIIRGLWRATAMQKGTGCPCCDKHLGHDHDHGAHGGGSAASAPEAKGTGSKS